MNINEYQEWTKTTAVFEKNKKEYKDLSKMIGDAYVLMGLSGEVGEILNKIKKEIRDNKDVSREDVISEMGDVLWYFCMFLNRRNISIEEVFLSNYEKLESRKKRNKIYGSGDER
jgi:NTP pyrophosphatase (non-canonical NTP hydrolase)